MSVERLFHWTCDTCGLEVLKHDYGVPPGFSAVTVEERSPDGERLMARTDHRCEACTVATKAVAGGRS